MRTPRLSEIIEKHSEFALKELSRRLAALPKSRYQDFMKSSEGFQRMQKWLQKLLAAMNGRPDIFFSDLKNIGYIRAHQGFQIDFIYQFHIKFLNIIWELLNQEHPDKISPGDPLPEAFKDLTNTVIHGLEIVTSSYLETREEIIHEKVGQLELLSDFTKKIIPTFSIVQIAAYVQKELVELFGAQASMLTLYNDDNSQSVYTYPAGQDVIEDLLPIAKATRNSGVSIFMASTGKITRNVNHLQHKRVVSVPIPVNRRRRGVLMFYHLAAGFRFAEKEHDFLLQFVNILVIALDNAMILEEMDKNRQEMHLLAGNMIGIQEQLRKRLAGDIHDTLTQTLTGVGYKIQYCKELYKKDPSALEEHFDGLIDTIHQAIAQSRQITSGLHPDLIVNVGLVPALQRYIENFEKASGITVRSEFPPGVQAPYAVSICLFRMVQEALTNVSKHANTDTVDVSLVATDGDIRLTIKDRGRGFKRLDLKPDLENGKKMGLMILKERVESVGGSFSVTSGSAKGCCLEATIKRSAKEACHG